METYIPLVNYKHFSLISLVYKFTTTGVIGVLILDRNFKDTFDFFRQSIRMHGEGLDQAVPSFLDFPVQLWNSSAALTPSLNDMQNLLDHSRLSVLIFVITCYHFLIEECYSALVEA